MQVTGLFFIHKINTPTKWSCDCCNSTLSCLQSGCSGAWNLSYYHLLTQAIMPILNWGTNQTVDMFKSFNTAWSSKVFYIKLITDNKDFSYESEIWWDDPQYHEADRYLKWLCYANFCAFHRTLKFLRYTWARSEGWWLILGNLRKSHHGLEIGGMMQCTMRRITSWNGYAQPMFAISDFGRPRGLSFSERIVCFENKQK